MSPQAITGFLSRSRERYSRKASSNSMRKPMRARPSWALGVYTVTRKKSWYSAAMTRPSPSASSSPRPQVTDKGSSLVNRAVPEYPFLAAAEFQYSR